MFQCANVPMTNKIEKFEDLECWKEARILVKMVYQMTSQDKFAKDFGLKDQVQRASISVMANIAEGFGTYSNQEFIRFLNFSYRSCLEVCSHLYAALDIEYISESAFTEIQAQAKKCANYTKAFIKYLKNKKT